MLINNGLAARPTSVYFSVSSILWNVYLLFKAIPFTWTFVSSYFYSCVRSEFFFLVTLRSCNNAARILLFFRILRLHTLIRVLCTLSNRTELLNVLSFSVAKFNISLSLSIGASGIHKPASVYVVSTIRVPVCESRGAGMCWWRGVPSSNFQLQLLWVCALWSRVTIDAS